MDRRPVFIFFLPTDSVPGCSEDTTGAFVLSRSQKRGAAGTDRRVFRYRYTLCVSALRAL